MKAYGGEVESLTQASSAGVGVRVIVDHREGFAYAGTLDEAVVLEALAEARDNAQFGEPDEFNGLATPDGVEPAELDLWPEGLADVPTADKVAMALELEAATKGRDPRVSGVRVAMYSDALGEGAVATSTGIRVVGPGRHELPDGAGARPAGRRDADRRRAVGRPRGHRPRRSTRRPTTPCCAPPACSAPPSPPRSGSPSCSSRG